MDEEEEHDTHEEEEELGQEIPTPGLCCEMVSLSLRKPGEGMLCQPGVSPM
jgi:hypothetical protein